MVQKLMASARRIASGLADPEARSPMGSGARGILISQTRN